MRPKVFSRLTTRAALLLGIAAIAVSIGTGIAYADAVATTSPATDVTDGSATLNGVASPTTNDTVGVFEYGPTRAFDCYGPAHTLRAGTTKVTTRVTGLLRDTTYYFRLIVVQNSYPASVSDGAVLTFKTRRGKDPSGGSECGRAG